MATEGASGWGWGNGGRCSQFQHSNCRRLDMKCVENVAKAATNYFFIVDYSLIDRLVASEIF